MSELIPRDTIKQDARAAAERGDPPTVCRYAKGTEAEYIWKDAYYVRVSQLQGVAA
jgi:hypothetical protein